jgi:hypothetical protein
VRLRWLIGALGATGILASATACTRASVVGAGHRAPCPAVFFGVAGSGEGPRFPTPSAVPPGVSRRDARDFGPLLAEVKGELARFAGPGLASATGLDYPAATASHWLGATGLTGLDASESAGTRALVAAIRHSYGDGCGARPVLLAGYSQGAEVVSRAVDALSPRRRRSITVALFGDPSFEPGRRGDVPADAAAAGIRPTLLAGSARQLPADVRARTIDVCAPHDPICGVPHSRTGVLGESAYVLEHLATHTSAYLDSGWVARAARFLWQHRVPMR